MGGGEEGVVVCGCNRSVNVNDTDPRRRVRSAKPSQKPPSGPHTEPSTTAAPRYAPGPRLALGLDISALDHATPSAPSSSSIPSRILLHPVFSQVWV